MRDRMERLAALPFSAGCISHTSVAVVGLHQQPRRSSKPALHHTKLSAPTRAREDDQESLSSGESMIKSPFTSRPNISTGFHRLFKSFKNISHLFENYKDEMEDEVEMEIEIGFPTDVKHIGFDGSNLMKSSWDSLNIHQSQDHELLSLPAANALTQLQLSMAQAPRLIG